MNKISQIKNRTIVIDSNIIINYASAGFKERSGNPLRILADNNNKIAITPVVAFEVLRGESRKEIRDKYLKFLNYVHTIEMTEGHFQNAAILAHEYRRVCKMNNVSVGDLLIGGTILARSFHKNAVLLFTGNRRHFCEPLWNTVAHLTVPSGKENDIQANLYLLEVNLDVFDDELKK